MTYQETVGWMFQQLPMYQQVGTSAYKKDLTNIIKLSDHLGEPHKKFKSIHVAGTNGKGSVSHMLASVLQQCGYKVGLYTSPHLKDFRERIKINGEMIPEAEVTGFIERNSEYLEQEKFSFFELTVGMAFEHFSTEKVDIAVIEVGLGGRLDSTNIISPEVSVVTNIGLDHTNILGGTLPEIASEKAGIIKSSTPVVIGEIHEDTLPVFIKKSSEKQAPLYLAEDYTGQLHSTDLKGEYQKKNVRTVLMTVEVMRSLGWQIPEEQLQEGLLHVVSMTGLRGRWEILQEEPRVICDTAHNKEGLQYALSQLKSETGGNLHFVLGMVNDKDVDSVLPLFPKEAVYYFCRPNVPRGMEADVLKKSAAGYGLTGNNFPSVAAAYAAAIRNAGRKDSIYIGGSTFVVAEIID